MEQAEDLLLRLDSQHNDLLKRIDELDQLITQVLQDWAKSGPPAVEGLEEKRVYNEDNNKSRVPPCS